MKAAPWFMALLVGMTGTVEARAQFFFSNSVAVSPIGAARSSSFVRLGPRPAFATAHYRWYFPTYYYPYSYWDYPYFGSGLNYSNPMVIINAPAPVGPVPQAPENLPKGKVIIKRDKEEAAEKPAPPLPGKEAGGFRPVQPADRARAQEPLPPEPPKIQEAKPQAAPLPLNSPPPPADFVIRGKQAFAAREYGRAERFFQQAIATEPQSHLPRFLLAQAQFALDKYREADDAILAGLRLEVDWPKSKFHPAELYADHPTDFQEQMDHLKELLDGKPADPVLLNLYAYQLWFFGRAEDAKPYFRRAAEITTDKIWTDFFLPASPQN